MTGPGDSPASDNGPERQCRPLRIFLTADAVGGVWDYAIELARDLVGAGHAVRLAVIGLPTPDRLATVPETVDLVGADYRLEWMPGSADETEAAGEWLARSAGEWNADVAHLNQMAYAVHDFGAPTLVVAHSDVRSWFSEVRGTDPPPEWDSYTRQVTEGLRAADIVAAPSAYQAELTRRHFGRTPDHVIHNGIRPPPAGRATDPTRSGIVVSAGRAWDEAKGMAVLDRAAGLLGGSGPELHVIGETRGPHGEEFTARHVCAHGRLPRRNLDAWLRRATVYVGASLYEPFGLAPLEAALHGTALVLSDIGSFRELWEGCAVFFPPGDAEGLAAAVAGLVFDDDRCRDLGQAARARAMGSYTADTSVARYLDLYATMRPELEAKPSCV